MQHQARRRRALEAPSKSCKPKPGEQNKWLDLSKQAVKVIASRPIAVLRCCSLELKSHVVCCNLILNEWLRTQSMSQTQMLRCFQVCAIMTRQHQGSLAQEGRERAGFVGSEHAKAGFICNLTSVRQTMTM